MTALEVLADLRSRGVKVTESGGKLRLEPASNIPPDMRPIIIALKGDLIAALRREEAARPLSPCLLCGGRTHWRYNHRFKQWLCSRCHPDEGNPAYTVPPPENEAARRRLFALGQAMGFPVVKFDSLPFLVPKGERLWRAYCQNGWAEGIEAALAEVERLAKEVGMSDVA